MKKSAQEQFYERANECEVAGKFIFAIGAIIVAALALLHVLAR